MKKKMNELIPIFMIMWLMLSFICFLGGLTSFAPYFSLGGLISLITCIITSVICIGTHNLRHNRNFFEGWF